MRKEPDATSRGTAPRVDKNANRFPASIDADHLTRADQHIAAAKKRIETQQLFIEHLARNDGVKAHAESLLALMQETLAQFQSYRRAAENAQQSLANGADARR
ncbi:hypothetical protein VSR68_09660 [Paraburkholderia phymatum]|uniref:hypothetical protein n=1 Tax=Paraburkholderia phymatum TaxID=148447 RepID=UPI003177945F